MTDVEIVEIESACVGCRASMTYVGETSGMGAPFFEPKESRADGVH